LEGFFGMLHRVGNSVLQQAWKDWKDINDLTTKLWLDNDPNTTKRERERDSEQKGSGYVEFKMR